MIKNLFLARAAKATFALAAVVMMSTAFTSCSKDNNDDNGGSPVPNVEDTKPLPTPKAQTVTLNGVEKPIVKAEYENKDLGNYYIFLNLSDDGKEKVQIELNKDLHITNTPIDLTQKEENHIKGEYYWLVAYYKSQKNKLIFTFGNPYAPQDPVFETGTLTVSGDPEDGTVSIKLENGRVIGSDKQDHTLTLSYSGSITKKKNPNQIIQNPGQLSPN